MKNNSLEIYNSYMNMIQKYIDEHIDGSDRISEDDVFKLIKELDKNNSLLLLTNEVLDVAANLIFNVENYIDYIRLLLIPNELKKNNKIKYYYMQFNNNFLDLEEEQIERIKYAKKYFELSHFYQDFRDRNLTFLLKYNNPEINCAMMVIISNYFDENPVINKKELEEYLLKFAKESNDFYESMQLNGIKEIFEDNNDYEKNELKFIEYVEYYYRNRNNKVNKRIF